MILRDWNKHSNGCKLSMNAILGKTICILLFLVHLHISPVAALIPSEGSIPNDNICIQRSWWHDYGLQHQQEYFNKQLRPKLALFKTEHYSRLKTLERLHQCNICYNVWKTDDVGSKQNILEQGCLSIGQECFKFSCDNLDDVKRVSDSPLRVTQDVHDNIRQSSATERNKLNTLNTSSEEVMTFGPFLLDVCCYSNPLDNCENQRHSRSSSNYISLPESKCIKNLDISSIEETNQHIFVFTNPNLEYQNRVLYYVLSILAFLMVLVVTITVVIRYLKLHQPFKINGKNDLESAKGGNTEIKMTEESMNHIPFDAENRETSSPSTAKIASDFSELTIGTCIEESRYGYSIFQGKLGSKPVMVKSFVRSKKQYYFNECEVYELINRRSQQDKVRDFLGYHGSGETLTSNDGQMLVLTNFLIVDRAEKGNLSEYLEKATISWSELCKMMSTISQGLSYLHGLNRNTEPSLCHRNINGYNILVKRDMSCCLCNFEHVVVSNQVGQSFLLANYSSAQNEPVSITQEPYNENQGDELTNGVVGSPRYLAPEILDHAIGIQQGELSYKQIDVYAMGLIFWEISRRCRDLYQGVSVPTYDKAFSQELGPERQNPSVQQMQILVSRYKARPLFPEIWKNSNPAIQRLRETIEDSWDQDGEARLTAICIAERVPELKILWERYKKASTLQHSQLGSSNQPNILPNNQSIQPSSGDGNNSFNSDPLALATTRPQNFHINRFDDERPSNPLAPGKNIPAKEKMDVNRIAKNNNLLSRQQTMAQIQPHQGRNPCMERNIASERHKAHVGDESCPLLIYGSVKDTPVQTGPLTDAYQRFDYEVDIIGDPSLDILPAGRHRGTITVPQPIQLNIQNDLGRENETYSNDCKENVRYPAKKGISMLSSLIKKKQPSKQSGASTGSKQKPDINQEWEKEYRSASVEIETPQEDVDLDDESQ